MKPAKPKASEVAAAAAYLAGGKGKKGKGKPKC